MKLPFSCTSNICVVQGATTVRVSRASMQTVALFGTGTAAVHLREAIQADATKRPYHDGYAYY
jgi:hypothetical protein